MQLSDEGAISPQVNASEHEDTQHCKCCETKEVYYFSRSEVVQRRILEPSAPPLRRICNAAAKKSHPIFSLIFNSQNRVVPKKSSSFRYSATMQLSDEGAISPQVNASEHGKTIILKNKRISFCFS